MVTTDQINKRPETEMERLGFADYENKVSYADNGLEARSPEFREWQIGWAKAYLIKDAKNPNAGKVTA